MENSIITPKGMVEVVIDHKDGRQERYIHHNTILTVGKTALVKSLAGEIGSSFRYYVCKMIFGTNGTMGGVPKFVDASRNGLFGPTLIAKNTFAILDPATPTKVIFTAILTFDDAIGATLNEMALQLTSDDLYSMITFSDVTKSASMQVTYNWALQFV